MERNYKEFKYLPEEFVEYIKLLGRKELKKRLKENNNFIKFTILINNRNMKYAMTLTDMENRNRSLCEKIDEELQRLVPNSNISCDFFFGYEVIVCITKMD